MYELSVDSKFAAAHCLKGYQGKCARLHGHTWLVTAAIVASSVNEIGLCIDFSDISRNLDEVVEYFDHQTLNDLKEFGDINPSSENIGKLIFEMLSEKINNHQIRVLSVTVAESDKYRVTYQRDESR